MTDRGSFPLASVGAIALIVLVFVRPQEFMPALEGIPIFNVAFGISVLGITLEMVLGQPPTIDTVRRSADAIDLVHFHLSPTSLALRRELGIAS